jgi:phthiocerol/phenolphthiocerol synthesis type-I polyketide synthase E
LDRSAANLARHLKEHPDLDLDAVAQTLSVGRREYAHRQACVCKDIHDGAMALALGDADRKMTGEVGQWPSEFVFVLTDRLDDDGDHATLLYAQSLPFRTAVERCRTELGTVAASASMFRADSAVAAFVAQYATAETLVSWGAHPVAVAGSGAGELVAAYLAGVLTLPTALRLAQARATGEPMDVGSPCSPRIPLLSTITGRWMDSTEARDPTVWASPRAAHIDVHAALAGVLGSTKVMSVRVQPGEHDHRGLAFLLSVIGRLWVHGVPVDWSAIYADGQFRRVPLPTYPFESRRYWVEPSSCRRNPEVSRPTKLVELFAGAGNEEKITIVTRFVQQEIAQLLGSVNGLHASSQTVDVDRNLFDLNLDSLALIQIAAKLSQELEVVVPASIFVSYPTIRTFVHNLAESMGFCPIPSREQVYNRTSRRARQAAMPQQALMTDTLHSSRPVDNQNG